MTMGAEQKFDWATSVASMMDWWREAGLDVAISETPRHWLQSPADSARPISVDAERPRPPVDRAQAPFPATPPPAPPIAPMPFDIATFETWRLSDGAPDAGWGDQRLGAQGDPYASLTVVIEMPEREDASAGGLLSGATGALFDRMLAAIGRDRRSIYLVPMCVVRPSTGSIPPDALPALTAALRHQIALSGARRALVMGNAASRALLGADIADRRGALRPINRNEGEQAKPIDAVASYHPRFLLERPAAKAEAWKDLLLLAQGIDA